MQLSLRLGLARHSVLRWDYRGRAALQGLRPGLDEKCRSGWQRRTYARSCGTLHFRSLPGIFPTALGQKIPQGCSPSERQVHLL